MFVMELFHKILMRDRRRWCKKSFESLGWDESLWGNVLGSDKMGISGAKSG